MRPKRKLKFSRICILTLMAVLLITGAHRTASKILPPIMDRLSEDISAHLSSSDLPSRSGAEEPVILNPAGRKLYSPYAILVRLQDRQVVFETRSEEQISPASLTKIMTAIVAIEKIPDLQEPVILPNEVFNDLYLANASMAGFLPGEEVPAIDLLYGTLLPSGADASLGLALKVAGSESEFVKLMNRKARQIGMKDTHFTNACGFYDENHYSTVNDIAVLLEYALQNETFREVFTSARHSTASTNRHPGGITFYSTMFAKTDTYEFDGGRILGAKTGYTAESGQCLASLAVKNGTEYILVTAGAAGDNTTKPYHIMDAFTVYGTYLSQ